MTIIYILYDIYSKIHSKSPTIFNYVLHTMRNYVSRSANIEVYQGCKILQGYEGQGGISRLHEKKTEKVKKTWQQNVAVTKSVARHQPGAAGPAAQGLGGAKVGASSPSNSGRRTSFKGKEGYGQSEPKETA